MTNVILDKPPRGYEFAVARMTHVAGGPTIAVRILPGRYATRQLAQHARDQIDKRLTPTVVIVPLEQARAA
jgi:hypothetical protein